MRWGPRALDGFHDNPPVDRSLPAGLGNIRNTCYLNSILQYLFTVRQVREIVLDWDKYGLENIEENLMARRIDPGLLGWREARPLSDRNVSLLHSYPYMYGVPGLISRSRQRASLSLLGIAGY